MAIGSDTIALNGIRTTTPTYASYNPLSFGPQTSGVPNVSPQLPPFLGGSAAGAPGTGTGGENVNGYGTAGGNYLATSIAGSNPHHFAVAPTWWVVIFLLVGLLLLKGVHWRDTTLEGFEAGGRVGPARAEASEEA